MFGRQAESVSNYLAKGRRVGVDGRLSWREWTAQDGSKRQNVEVIAQDVFFLDSRGEGGGGGGGGQTGWSAPAGGNDIPTDTSDMRSQSTPVDIDIPF